MNDELYTYYKVFEARPRKRFARIIKIDFYTHNISHYIIYERTHNNRGVFVAYRFV